jgi:hypothetical protein
MWWSKKKNTHGPRTEGTSEQLASSLYLIFIRDGIKGPEKDIDGNTILDEDEQRLLILSHLCELLEARDFKKTKLLLLSLFVKDTRKIKNEGELAVEMLVALGKIEKIKKFFEELPKESHEFIAKDWVFKRELNPIQKIMILPWYVEHTKAITETFDSVLVKIKVVDEEETDPDTSADSEKTL